jgi:preprotein translocase subunit SecG
MYTVLTVLHVIVCSFLILVVLLQAGKGGGMGIAFGGGGSQTVFGSSGAGNFLTRLTAICATIFFVNSLILAALSSRQDSARLQTLSQRKAVEKAQQQAATDKMAKDLEKARQEIDKTSAGKSPAGAVPATPGATPAEPPASAPAPATAPAEEGTKAPPAATKTRTRRTKAALPPGETPAKAPAENNPPPPATTP